MMMALMVRPASATLITFDDLPATVTSEVVSGSTVSGYKAVRPGHYNGSAKLVVSVSGITVTISRQNGAAFDIVNNDDLLSQQGKGASFGSRSIDPFADTTINGFIISFSDDIRALSLLSGDFGGDPDGLILKAYYGADLTGGFVPDSQYTSTIAGNITHAWTQDRFYTAVTNPADAGFKSVLFYGGTANLSVFIDRLWFSRDPDEVAALIEDPGLYYYDEGLDDAENTGDSTSLIPEPASIALFTIGASLLAFTRRKHA
jgi:hypothetical protein